MPEVASDRFDKKVAIVTGAAGGIGEAYARELAREGASVVVADIDVERGRKVASELDGLFAQVDVGDEASTFAMVNTVLEHHGTIDHLVNNAAIFGGMKIDTLTGVEWEYYRKFMSVNMDGALLCTRACAPHMPEGGSIVNQSSTAAWMYSGFYGVAKAGINAITQQTAHELGGRGIRVNAIAPGPIDTEAMRSTVPQEFVEQMINGQALKRLGKPDDLVGLCLFLLSDEADWITGHVFNVDGGQIFRS